MEVGEAVAYSELNPVFVEQQARAAEPSVEVAAPVGVA